MSVIICYPGGWKYYITDHEIRLIMWHCLHCAVTLLHYAVTLFADLTTAAGGLYFSFDTFS